MFALTSCTREDFGVASASLLGDGARIEAILADKGLDRTSKECDLREITGPVRGDDGSAVPGRCVMFTDDDRPGDKQTAKLYYAVDGRLVALRVDLRSDARDYDKGYYKIGRFLFDYWNAVGGKDKAFGQAPGDVPILGKEALEARIEDQIGLEGRWIKQCFEGNLHDRVVDEVLVRLL